MTQEIEEGNPAIFGRLGIGKFKEYRDMVKKVFERIKNARAELRANIDKMVDQITSGNKVENLNDEEISMILPRLTDHFGPDYLASLLMETPILSDLSGKEYVLYQGVLWVPLDRFDIIRVATEKLFDAFDAKVGLSPRKAFGQVHQIDRNQKKFRKISAADSWKLVLQTIRNVNRLNAIVSQDPHFKDLAVYPTWTYSLRWEPDKEQLLIEGHPDEDLMLPASLMKPRAELRSDLKNFIRSVAISAMFTILYPLRNKASLFDTIIFFGFVFSLFGFVYTYVDHLFERATFHNDELQDDSLSRSELRHIVNAWLDGSDLMLTVDSVGPYRLDTAQDLVNALLRHQISSTNSGNGVVIHYSGKNTFVAWPWLSATPLKEAFRSELHPQLLLNKAAESTAKSELPSTRSELRTVQRETPTEFRSELRGFGVNPVTVEIVPVNQHGALEIKDAVNGSEEDFLLNYSMPNLAQNFATFLSLIIRVSGFKAEPIPIQYDAKDPSAQDPRAPKFDPTKLKIGISSDGAKPNRWFEVDLNLEAGLLKTKLEKLFNLQRFARGMKNAILSDESILLDQFHFSSDKQTLTLRRPGAPEEQWHFPTISVATENGDMVIKVDGQQMIWNERELTVHLVHSLQEFGFDAEKVTDRLAGEGIVLKRTGAALPKFIPEPWKRLQEFESLLKQFSPIRHDRAELRKINAITKENNWALDEYREGVLVLTYRNIEKLNAMSLDNIHELERMYGKVREIAVARKEKGLSTVLIERGLGSFHSAGADQDAFNKVLSEGGSEGIARFGREYSRVWSMKRKMWEELGVLSIAAISRPALGGGAEWPLESTLRMIDKGKGEMAQTEITLGLLGGAGAVVYLARLVGIANALLILLSGGRVPADVAYAIGWVDEIVDEGQVFTHALAVSDRYVEEVGSGKRFDDPKKWLQDWNPRAKANYSWEALRKIAVGSIEHRLVSGLYNQLKPLFDEAMPLAKEKGVEAIRTIFTDHAKAQLQKWIKGETQSSGESKNSIESKFQDLLLSILDVTFANVLPREIINRETGGKFTITRIQTTEATFRTVLQSLMGEDDEKHLTDVMYVFGPELAKHRKMGKVEFRRFKEPHNPQTGATFDINRMPKFEGAQPAGEEISIHVFGEATPGMVLDGIIRSGLFVPEVVEYFRKFVQDQKLFGSSNFDFDFRIPEGEGAQGIDLFNIKFRIPAVMPEVLTRLPQVNYTTIGKPDHPAVSVFHPRKPADTALLLSQISRLNRSSNLTNEADRKRDFDDTLVKLSRFGKHKLALIHQALGKDFVSVRPEEALAAFVVPDASFGGFSEPYDVSAAGEEVKVWMPQVTSHELPTRMRVEFVQPKTAKGVNAAQLKVKGPSFRYVALSVTSIEEFLAELKTNGIAYERLPRNQDPIENAKEGYFIQFIRLTESDEFFGVYSPKVQKTSEQFRNVQAKVDQLLDVIQREGIDLKQISETLVREGVSLESMLREVLRDAIQNHPHAGNLTQADIEAMIKRFFKSGLSGIEAVSFVSPKRIPVMKHASGVAGFIAKNRSQWPHAKVSYLIFSKDGAETALTQDPDLDQLGIAIALSPKYAATNTGTADQEEFFAKSLVPQLEFVRTVNESTRKEKPISLRGYLSNVWEASIDDIVKWIKIFHANGVKEIALSDTTGIATPKTIREVVEAVQNHPDIKDLKDLTFVLHLHDSGVGLANVLAGIQSGIRIFDSSIGNLGGSPFSDAQAGTSGRKPGNIGTEDLVFLLDALGVPNIISFSALLEATRFIESTTAVRLF